MWHECSEGGPVGVRNDGDVKFRFFHGVCGLKRHVRRQQWFGGGWKCSLGLSGGRLLKDPQDRTGRGARRDRTRVRALLSMGWSSLSIGLLRDGHGAFRVPWSWTRLYELCWIETTWAKIQGICDGVVAGVSAHICLECKTHGRRTNMLYANCALKE